MQRNNEKYIGITTKEAVAIAVFSAMAFAVTFVFRLPVSFLTFDAKDAVITVAAFVYGPFAAALMALISALLEMITVSSTGLYGFVMNFISSAAFSVPASWIYRKHRTANGALFALGSGVFAMTAVMMLFNLFITPFYLGCPRSEVVALIPTLLLPFNLAKSVMNASLTIFLYKPIASVLRRSGFAEQNPSQPWRLDRRSAVMIAVAAAGLILSVIAFILLRR